MVARELFPRAWGAVILRGCGYLSRRPDPLMREDTVADET
jgi:hypothetical protein